MASGFDNKISIIAELYDLLSCTYCIATARRNLKGNE